MGKQANWKQANKHTDQGPSIGHQHHQQTKYKCSSEHIEQPVGANQALSNERNEVRQH